MRRSIASLLLLLIMIDGDRATASMCSSRDGTKYCECEYNQVCTAGETSCSCSRSPDEVQPRVVMPAPLSLQPPIGHAPSPRRSEPVPPAPAPAPAATSAPSLAPAPPPAPALSPAPAPPPAPVVADGEERSPADYIRLAQKAIAVGRLDAAVDFIDKAQTRLLDRSVALNRTFDPITDEPIKQLSMAKQALQGKNRERAGKSLDAALAAIH